MSAARSAGAITQKLGRLRTGGPGTLSLDEVSKHPDEVQPKLLRALQEREFERLGSTRTKKVDVRLVAATNRDLEKMIETREFRSDLYYRLNVFPIRIPPLRERPEDIPLLVRYFAQKYGRRMEKRVESVPARRHEETPPGIGPVTFMSLRLYRTFRDFDARARPSRCQSAS
jgi:formate hydrogenlyase transcriptional activator